MYAHCNVFDILTSGIINRKNKKLVWLDVKPFIDKELLTLREIYCVDLKEKPLTISFNKNDKYMTFVTFLKYWVKIDFVIYNHFLVMGFS